MTIEADQALLQQAIYNLVENALEIHAGRRRGDDPSSDRSHPD